MKITRTVINYPYPPYFYNIHKKFKNYHDQGNFGLNFVTFCHNLKVQWAQNLLNYAYSYSACQYKSNGIKNFQKCQIWNYPYPESYKLPWSGWQLVFAKKFENYPYHHKLPGYKLRVPYCSNLNFNGNRVLPRAV